MKRPTITWQRVVRSYPCPDCDAAPGEHCVTRNGNDAYEPHVERSRLAASNGWQAADGDLEADQHRPKRGRHRV